MIYTSEAGQEQAELFRDKYGLAHQPLGDLITLIEQTVGADVAIIDAPADEHGMTMRHRERGTVFIAVARTDRPMRQRSTLAHELGHVLFGDWNHESTSPVEKKQIETRADTFARHLLIPHEGVLESLAHAEGQPQNHEAALSRIVQRFLVSPAIAAIAMEQVHAIDRETKARFMSVTTPKLAARYGWSDQYRAIQLESQRLRAPQQLLTRAVTGYMENLVTIQQLAALRGMPTADIEQEYRDAGIAPTPIEPTWGSVADLPKLDIDLSDLDAELAAGGE